MNKVDKQFSKLDKKASKLVRRCEKESKSKGENKAIKPLYIILFVICLLLICFNAYLYINYFFEISIIKLNFKYIGIIPFLLLMLSFIISIFIKSKFTAYTILSLAYIDIFVFIWATFDKNSLNNKIHIFILSVVIFLISSIILLKLVSYRRNKYLK